MQERAFDRLETDALDDVEALLQGRVFHVTKRDYWPSILRAGAIQSNRDGSLQTTFGFSKNSYFRNRGCVSVFDWRAPWTEELDDYRRRCWPFSAATAGSPGIAIALLRSSVEERLRSWEGWKEECAWSEMVVPYAEAGHPGPIPTTDIEEVVFLRLRKSDEDPWLVVMRRAQQLERDST